MLFRSITTRLKKGYVVIKILQKNYSLHRLIAINFIPNPLNLPIVNHKNGIRNDNRVENLEWVTQKENVIDGFKRGRKNPSGEHNGNCKLKEVEITEIRKLISEGVRPKEISEKFSISQSHISRIKSGKKRKLNPKKQKQR